MKVLIVNRHKDDILGGSEIQCDLIAKSLIGMDVDVIYVAMQSNRVFQLLYEVIPMQAFSVKRFAQILSENKPDVVYWRYNNINLKKAVEITHEYDIKFIYSLSHENDVKKWMWYWKFDIDSIGISIKQLFSVVKDNIIRRYNFSAFNIIDGVVSLRESFLPMLPNRFDATNSIAIRNSMDYKPDGEFNWKRPYIVWVANVKAPKRPELYIKLAESLKNEDVDFIMIGKVQDSNYEYVNDASKLPRNLYYLGKKPVHEVETILSGSLMMIHTCIPEGFGNNFIQSWYAGKPTISLSFDPDDMIKNYNLGFVSGSFEKMVEQTRQLINDSKLREEMGERAKKVAQEHFVPQKNHRKLYDFIQSILDK